MQQYLEDVPTYCIAKEEARYSRDSLVVSTIFCATMLLMPSNSVYANVTTENHNTISIPHKNKASEISEHKVVTVESCVQDSKKYLGLKVIEIAKILDVSRASLDLYRKGSPFKNNDALYELSELAAYVAERYDTMFASKAKSVLIGKKTAIQIMIENRNDLGSLKPVITRLMSDIQINTYSSPMEKSTRLANIGRKA